MSIQATTPSADEEKTNLLGGNDEKSAIIPEQVPNKEDKGGQENLRCTLPAFAAFMLLGAIWGSAFLFIRFGVDLKNGFPPITLVMLRLQLASVFMLAMLFVNCLFSADMRSQVRQHSGFDKLVKFAILGFFNNAVPFITVGIAEQTINTGVVRYWYVFVNNISILDASIPLFGLIFAHFALKGERMSFLKVIGLLVGFAGVVMVCFQKVRAGEAIDFTEFWGYILVTIASASYAVASVFSKKYLSGIPGLYLATGQIVSAALMCTIGSLIVDLGIDDRHYRFFATADLMAWISVAYLGFFSTVIAYILYFYLIRTVGSVKQTMVGYLLPVFGVFIGAIFLKEWDGVAWWFIVSEVLGAVLICAGIAAVSFSLPERWTRPCTNLWRKIRKLPPVEEEESQAFSEVVVNNTTVEDLEKDSLIKSKNANYYTQ